MQLDLPGRPDGRAFLYRPELVAAGYRDRDIAEALRSTWTTVRPGAYVPRALWDSLDGAGRHVLRAQACAGKLGDRVALSHHTALAVRGLPPDGADLEQVALIRLDGGSGRTEGGVRHHEAKVPMHVPVERVGGLLVVDSAYAVRQTATGLDRKRTLGLLDAAYHLGLADDERIARWDEVAERWPGSARFRLVRPLADARVESYGETYVRWVCHRFGLPMPEPQVEVCEHGRLVGRADFCWLHGRLLGEFDGKIKYTRYLREGETPADAVMREKRRGERLADSGSALIRFTWEDVLDRHEERTADRIRRRLAAASRLEIPDWAARRVVR